MTVADITESVQYQVLDGLKQYQDVLIEAVRGWTETVEEIIPGRPELPFADQLPRPTEVAGNVFDFAEKLLANQREFVTNVLNVAEPFVTGTETTKKTAAPKSTAPKSTAA
ncbi:MAG TPA: hypothetical protein VH112_12180 [Acidimicrobiales bacterium]|nr:hypothetical protein [Acidimicrobiales bacterium]